ncbi:MAG TPA: class I SAM-dependent methyltransferase [Spirochaetota bacterium]|jgi:ubiquinone/menaquinone biosynthesis C-methylase UbiE|nr:class I SAM-dependent methyltransferase [Spirochaetota bacterium]OQA98022.1 MAG: Demethylrebeccamycin-D-glucose O-methyltransferase [Spirochaetes bacterium ADurb.Bin218]HOK00978.1 class I SAM-dependent methyltransferase [Spirochaetota bacterium]HOK91305.1 class I SAM-dependent methyltransferase [Spirochaetota bacterium]HON14870.1 class I SAM-dependent methyltransferase [Spirochaetota bacterium]
MLTVDFDKLSVREGDVVLDAGCGLGRHSIAFMQRGAKVFCMDLDLDSLLKTRYTLASMIKQGRAHKKSRFLTHIGDALNLPFKDETFDRIICSEVMEHVNDDFKACAELARVLKKNGRIAITVPTYISEIIYDAITYEYFTSPGGHVRKYHPSDLANIMRANGLEIYAIGFKHSFHTIWWIIRGVVGLHDNDHPITKAYHKFLHLGLMSNFMRKVESFFDNFFPKSIVLYAWKK